ncbi:MAG: tRNA uridine-5-carboxymethylaminomethyl(34) synthesis GTPase MnmE [Campylobacteraceae bacterium]|nr:tRNA uridine-5-carboxymethylaminomethyl(34) synthesis GTPase MnmE [Campylobacteraceae bacterium]
MGTIAAVATAYGVGSIAIVRVSGDRAYKIALLLSGKKVLTPRYAALSYIYNEIGEVLDQAIIVYFKAPHSYTAEDVVEFQCHGGIVTANMILEAVLRQGARLANPGEFTKRAFLNGRIDLSKAEAIGKLIDTKSVSAAKLLSRHLKGELKEFVDKARVDLLEIIAFTEVTIDYAEEDLPQNMGEQIEEKLYSLSLKMERILENSKQREGLIEGFRVAIVGKTNVGKSSLLNRLLCYERAITSDIEGTTRDTIEEEIKIGTHIVRFVDTAGIRESDNEIERIGIERSLKAVESADIIIAVFDNARAADNEDIAILKLLSQDGNGKKIIHVLNKCDLKNSFDKKLLNNPVNLSCIYDIKPLTDTLDEYLNTLDAGDEIILSSLRQIEAVSKTIDNIKTAQELIKDGALELFSFHLNEAINALSSITEAYERDEILEVMFSKFCLGK